DADVVQQCHELDAVLIQETMDNQGERKHQKYITRRYGNAEKRENELRAAIVDTGLSRNQANDVHARDKPSQTCVPEGTSPAIHRTRSRECRTQLTHAH